VRETDYYTTADACSTETDYSYTMTASATRLLRLDRFVGPDEQFHLARCDYAPGRRVGMHRHDFTELFWVIAGRGRHQVNGVDQKLATGMVVLVRPDDCHALAAGAGERFAIFNLAFRTETARFLQTRYFGGEAWPWTGGATPATYRLDRPSLERWNRDAHRLADAPQTRLALEAFLLGAIESLTDPAPAGAAGPPDWLTRAIHDMDQPDKLREGARALARLADRSAEHVNRTVRRCYDCTATELVNDLRLNRAARLLRMTDLAIPDVAARAGYDNLGYFYRRFARRYETTPRRFRLDAQAVAR